MSSISLIRSGLIAAATFASLSAAAAAPVLPGIDPAVAGGGPERPILVWGGGHWDPPAATHGKGIAPG